MREGLMTLALPRRRACNGHTLMRDNHEKSETCEPRTHLSSIAHVVHTHESPWYIG